MFVGFVVLDISGVMMDGGFVVEGVGVFGVLGDFYFFYLFMEGGIVIIGDLLVSGVCMMMVLLFVMIVYVVFD